METSGALLTGAGLLAGLDAPAAPDPARDAPIAAVHADPCAALFGPQTDPHLPIAFFSDFNCPNGRVLEAILLDYDAAHPNTIRIIRHELPLLGAASTVASQAVLAADRLCCANQPEVEFSLPLDRVTPRARLGAFEGR